MNNEAGLHQDRPPGHKRTPPIKLAIHGAMYDWAAPFMSGMTVLDLGCAEGFGSAVLARSALKVTGVDWDDDLIGTARRMHPERNIHFIVGDCQRLALRPESFDAVMNNALLEHVHDEVALMRSACRCLRPAGIMICGTKNYDLSLKKADGSPLYDNHLREYTARSLCEMMQLYFRDVTLYLVLMSERAERFLMNRAALGVEGVLVSLKLKSVIPPSFRNWVRRLVTGVDVGALAYSDFTIRLPSSEADNKHAAYLIAVGRGKRNSV